jgi:hypothetical protein
MKRSRIRRLWLVAAVFALCAALVLTGCGSNSKVAEIEANASVGNDAHQATITVSEVVYGNALLGVVLIYPDGNAELVTSGNLSVSGSDTWTGNNLPSGDYSYNVYVIPAGPDDPSTFPTGQMVEANVAASGTFTIQ